MITPRAIFTKFSTDDLIRHSALLFSGMMVVNVCNVLFQMVVGRALPDKEYALLAAFMGLLAIISRPLTTLTTSISHYTSLLCQTDQTGDAARLLKKWLLLTGIPGILLGGTVVFFNQSLAEFFHLERAAPVIIAGFMLPGLFWLPVLNGSGQGLQRFGWCSFSTISGAVFRLGLGAGFVVFIYPACGWALAGHSLSLYASAGVLLAGLLLVLRKAHASKAALPSIRYYLLQSFIIQASFAILMTADIVLVKHFLPDNTDFAYAATIGRMVVFLPGPIVMAMFPKVASKGAGSEMQNLIFIKSLLWTSVFVALTVLVCFFIPTLLAEILFGIKDVSIELKRMIQMMSIVMAFSTLLNVLVQFLIAQRRFITLTPIVLCACLYLILSIYLHKNAEQIILLAGCTNLIALGCLIISLKKTQGNRFSPQKTTLSI